MREMARIRGVRPEESAWRGGVKAKEDEEGVEKEDLSGETLRRPQSKMRKPGKA